MAGTSSGSCTYYKSRCSLPSAWEPRVTGIRNQHTMQYLKVDGTRVRYVGPGDEDSQAATIRSNYPLPADCPLYYFEVKVADKGQAGYIGIGFCTEDVILARLPGWELHSYGYHGDDGHAFSGSGNGRPFGPPYTTGDVVGALFNKAERSISYFKNGAPLGVAFRDIQESSPLYPCVGMRTKGEEVVANFGAGSSSEPFRTDFGAIRANFQRQVMASVCNTELPLLSSRGTALLPQLMYDYLMHQRFWRTAAVLGHDLLRSEGQLDEQELSNITVRQQSYDLVAAGRIDDALALLRDKYPPELLTERPALDLRLRVQKFVEMVAVAHAAADLNKSKTCTAAAAVKTAFGGNTLTAAAAAPSTSGIMLDGTSAAASSADTGSLAPMDIAEEASCEAQRAGVVQAGASGRADVTGGPELAAEKEEAEAPPQPPTTEEILAYGRTELWPRCQTPADRDLLMEAVSLLAFDNPAASPAGDMLRPAHRTMLAEELNGAMLACRGLPATSPLERLYQQVTALISLLKHMDHPQALVLPEPRQLVMEPTPGVVSSNTGISDSGVDALDMMAA
ncbi:hypothetical protein VaNZ11_003004 [Volvox africanus]|uniref:B30.2/SPRY domain-containing protein n=1 Tax=Volvox africanus TaxID=51714 RepID=A0ABQ5RUR4_9CHLO|nr:hypothetical protein VaNZ11_003004 [Volvox africanus]